MFMTIVIFLLYDNQTVTKTTMYLLWQPDSNQDNDVFVTPTRQ